MSSPKSLNSIQYPAKKARVSAAEKAIYSQIIIPTSDEDKEVKDTLIKRKQPNGTRKRAWW